jgi:hypothetical protein
MAPGQNTQQNQNTFKQFRQLVDQNMEAAEREPQLAPFYLARAAQEIQWAFTLYTLQVTSLIASAGGASLPNPMFAIPAQLTEHARQQAQQGNGNKNRGQQR